MAKVFGLENGPEDVYLDHISEVDSDEEHRDADVCNSKLWFISNL